MCDFIVKVGRNETAQGLLFEVNAVDTDVNYFNKLKLNLTK